MIFFFVFFTTCVYSVCVPDCLPDETCISHVCHLATTVTQTNCDCDSRYGQGCFFGCQCCDPCYINMVCLNPLGYGGICNGTPLLCNPPGNNCSTIPMCMSAPEPTTGIVYPGLFIGILVFIVVMVVLIIAIQGYLWYFRGNQAKSRNM